MATLSRLIFCLLLVAFFFGKLFPVIDIFIVIFALSNLFSQKNIHIKNIYMTIFVVISIISNLLYFNYIAWIYLIRLISLVSLLISPPKIDQVEYKFLNIILSATVIFGLAQYLVWPDLTIMSSQNWDPHLYRLVGSYFDPTFTGLILLFILLYVYFSTVKFKKYLLLLIYLALALTYSRSTILCFLVVFSYISYATKNWKIFAISLLFFLATIMALPRLPGEGTKLERTSSIIAKIDNYKQGLEVFFKHPFIGIGYNNIPSLNYKNDQSSHSNSGFDGSLLNIAITTGILGLIFLLLGLRYEFINGNIFYRSMLLAILFHSLFANSLFYPYTFLLLALLKSKSQK